MSKEIRPGGGRRDILNNASGLTFDRKRTVLAATKREVYAAN